MNRKVVLIASLVAGLLAAFLTRVYIGSKESEVRRREAAFKKKFGEEMKVLCLKKDMGDGDSIGMKDLTNCVVLAKGNADAIPADRADEIVRTGMKLFGFRKAGEPLRWSHFETEGQYSRGLTDRIPSPKGQMSYRAMSIGVTGASSVAGAIRRGDKVDVIGTLVFPNDEGKLHRGDPVTFTILQNVDVLATGGEDSFSRGRGLGLSGDAARGGGYSLVTLSVTPREAEMLAFVEQIKGRLTLTLRRNDDFTTGSELKPIHYDTIVEDIKELKELREKAQNGSR
ncbi:MAG: Flp pilus assembly protein CpaB [Kiritimatiellae bacterium]|nr:Flp pilus assembly protein CpaB [Kiritimatiellia bacterium]